GLPSPRCPECGRTFNPSDPRTFARHPPRVRLRRRLRAAAFIVATLLLLIAIPIAWLWWGWHNEQTEMALLRAIGGTNSGTRSIGPPWARARLGRFAFILDRVSLVRLYRHRRTDAGLEHVARLKYLQSLDLTGSNVTDS